MSLDASPSLWDVKGKIPTICHPAIFQGNQISGVCGKVWLLSFLVSCVACLSNFLICDCARHNFMQSQGFVLPLIPRPKCRRSQRCRHQIAIWEFQDSGYMAIMTGADHGIIRYGKTDSKRNQCHHCYDPQQLAKKTHYGPA